MEKYSKNSSIPKIIKKVLPAVVSIVVSKMLPVFEAPFGGPSDPSNPNAPPMIPKGKKKINVGGGSGFIVNPSGIILTNRHVVNDPSAEYIVIVDEDEKYPAKILARDPIHDVAILRIDKKNLPIIELGNSSGLELGQTAIAIGNALGTFRNTVSVGVVSGLAREISAGDTTNNTVTKLRGLVQTDAAINPGNSGGPLIDVKGKVIGINTAMVFFAENIGFALPINNAKKDLDDLKKYGRLRLPFLGIRYVLLDKELQERFKLSIDHGALVIAEKTPQGSSGAVVLGSTAHQAGVQEGDIILEVQDIKISAKSPLEDILQKCKIGENLNLKIFRKNQEIVLKVRLDERK
ncbi:MAG: trypsin-like peptidase domain-containing protein [Candidatus Nealsonbacteria bacterium]